METTKPGRPARPDNERRTKKINLYFTADEHAQLASAAGREPLAAYVRRVALEASSRKAIAPENGRWVAR